MRSPLSRSLIVSLRHVLMVGLVSLAMPLLAQPASPLPDYVPSAPVTGVIRSTGNPAMSALMKRWAKGFQRYHPDTYFTDKPTSSAAALAGLSEWTADLALMGRQIFTYEYYGVYRRSLMLPIEVEVATGSVEVPTKSPAVAVFVHRENPLHQLTLKQLDGIFGAEREGGWQGMVWEKKVARSNSENLRTWGQLGLTGTWADKPIHPYGPPGLYPGGYTFFQRKVLGGADTWAESLMEFDDRKEMMKALAADPYGIAYGDLSGQSDATRVVALAEHDGSAFVAPTRETVASRTYPLSRPVYIYYAPDTPGGEKASPADTLKAREFLKYVLSRQGQQDVADEGDYLPLTGESAAAQRAKLEPTGE